MSLNTTADLVVFNFDFIYRNKLLNHLRNIVIELAQYGINVAILSGFDLNKTIIELQKVEPCFDKLFCNITSTLNVHNDHQRMNFLVDVGFNLDQTLFLNFRTSYLFRNNLHLNESIYYDAQKIVEHLLDKTNSEKQKSEIEYEFSENELELVG